MAAFHGSSSSDGEDFEGFVVSPDEKASYKVWSKKRRRLSEAFDDSGSEENESGEEDDDDDDDDDGDDDDDEEEDDYESDNEETLIENEDEENDELDDALDDIQLQDSGDETLSSHTDQCPVCLMSLKEQLLGTPNNCPHVFCFECIQEWAKNATTCPVGRKPFTEILVHATRKGPILQRISVEERKAGDDEEEDDPTYCEVCGEGDREDRMLLCDGCDQGYHMECLNPPVEFVPVEEWYCPGCSSHEDPEEHLEEEHREEGLREVPRARATRGRPRGSTARRVSVSGRTDTTRRARTVASTRGRGRTGRGRGRGRGRSSSRGHGRGGRRTTTRGRSTTKTTTGRKKKRKKKRGQSKKKSSRTRTKRRKTSSKTKTLKPLKRRRIAEEDEVSPFIYEPKRRGRTVHARLLESLNSPGPATEPGRTASLGRVPFPSRLEPSSSFSLFGNAYALHDFADREDDTPETFQVEEKTTAWSSESTNPDVLGSIFQGLDSLHSSSAQVTRGGKILTTANQSPTKGSSSSNVKSSKDKLTTCEDEMKLESDMEIKRTSEEEKYLKTLDNSSNKPDVAKHLRQDQRSSDEQCSSGNIFEKLSSSRTADLHSGSCYKPSDTKQRAKTSSSPSTSLKSGLSPPSTPVSSKSTLSGFRIPKRNSKSQDEPNQTSLSSGNSPIHVKQETSSSISNFKIPKRTNSMSGGDSSRDESSKVNIAKPANVKCSGQKLMSSVSGVEQNLPLSHYTSSSKGITHSGCVTESKSAGSSLAYSNRVRPFVHETLQRRNSLNSSTTAYEGSVTSASNAIRNHAKTISSNSTISGTSISTSLSHAEAGPVRKTNSSSVTRYPTKNVSSITPSHTTTTINRTAQSVTSLSSETACHAKKVSNFPRSHTKTSNSVTPLTKVAPLIDHLKPVGGKEQRRSNIEIIKMLQEKQKSIRDQLSGDSSHSGHSGMTDTGELPKKVIPVSDKTPTCSREVTLPVAIVKPSRQMPSVTVNAPSSLPSSSLESSPVKSIASGIINAHSCNAQEFKRVRSESDPVGSGLKRSSSHTEREAKARKHEGLGTGADGNRDQQRKSGIVRLQRQQQIVDEVKLALKPFFKHGEIDKDDYKLIMRKSVEKIEESSSSVDRDRVCRLVKKYIKKVKGVNWSP